MAIEKNFAALDKKYQAKIAADATAAKDTGSQRDNFLNAWAPIKRRILDEFIRAQDYLLEKNFHASAQTKGEQVWIICHGLAGSLFSEAMRLQVSASEQSQTLKIRGEGYKGSFSTLSIHSSRASRTT